MLWVVAVSPELLASRASHPTLVKKLDYSPASTTALLFKYGCVTPRRQLLPKSSRAYPPSPNAGPQLFFKTQYAKPSAGTGVRPNGMQVVAPACGFGIPARAWPVAAVALSEHVPAAAS